MPVVGPLCRAGPGVKPQLRVPVLEGSRRRERGRGRAFGLIPLLARRGQRSRKEHSGEGGRNTAQFLFSAQVMLLFFLFSLRIVGRRGPYVAVRAMRRRPCLGAAAEPLAIFAFRTLPL